MSSIIKVKNGKGEHWKAIYDLPKSPDGKRNRTSRTFESGTPLRVVKEFLAEKELEAKRSGEIRYDYNITIGELAEIYFDTYTHFLSPTTLKGYKAVYYNKKDYGIKNYFENFKIRSTKTKDIQNFINYNQILSC